MRHPIRSTVMAGVALLVSVVALGCALNAEGEGFYDEPEAGVAGGGAGGSLPDVTDVSVEDALPDIPAPTDVPCFPPKKVCDGVCDFPDPLTTGCSSVSGDCDPCPDYANASVSCEEGACKMGPCEAPFADCDLNPLNGCETSLNTLDDCGGCGATCARDNAVAECGTGVCRIATCNGGFDNCDQVDDNGCEVNLHTLDHCGSCTAPPCTVPNGEPTCVTGTCLVNLCTVPLTADCDQDPSNGCEVDLTSLNNCNGCGNLCSRNHATATCAGGVCAISLCDQDYGSCNLQDGDGCETNIGSNPSHCGSCGGVCSPAHSTNVACVSQQCVNTCEGGWSDCNGPQPGNADDGCEIQTATDVLHCGACNNAVCSSNNVTAPHCAAGVCDGACVSGFADCDANKLTNGCEINLTNDISHCGGCNDACSSVGGTPSCASSQCSIACSAGRANCNGDVGDGCEINTTSSPDNCSACGTVCSNNNMSTRTCTNSVCNGTCASGFSDCNSNKQTDGCEMNTGSNVDNCGSCGSACSSTNITRACSSGQCTGACNTGFGDCNNNKRTDGCETNLDTSVDHCGACAAPCSASNIARACTSGQCTGTCNTGFGDCNTNKRTDGCEVNFGTNADNCGGCGTVCSSSHMATRTCGSGVCNGTCSLGYQDCNGNKQSDGCEQNVATDADNCGGCGTICSGSNIVARTCLAGLCNGVCVTGYRDCNTNKQTDGCELDVRSNPDNCGACGTVCSSNHMATRTCTASVCDGTCVVGYTDCNTNKQTDGCEVDTASDPNHCGTCTTVCSNNHMQTRTCGSGVCNGTCAAAYEDCNTNKQTDGCEANLQTGPDTCGACNKSCSNNNIPTRLCAAGICTGVCASGYADCNTDKLLDGCEIATATDVLNCGACARPCSSDHVDGTLTCNAGLCDTTACAPTWTNVTKPAAPAADDGCETH